MMIKIFIDSSVLIADLFQMKAHRQNFEFCESKIVEGWISSQVIKEVEENIKKNPQILNGFQKLKLSSNLKILKIPNPSILERLENGLRIKMTRRFWPQQNNWTLMFFNIGLKAFYQGYKRIQKSELQIMTRRISERFIKFC